MALVTVDMVHGLHGRRAYALDIMGMGRAGK